MDTYCPVCGYTFEPLLSQISAITHGHGFLNCPNCGELLSVSTHVIHDEVENDSVDYTEVTKAND